MRPMTMQPIVLRQIITSFLLLILIAGCYSQSQNEQATKTEPATSSMESKPDENTNGEADSEQALLAKAFADVESGDALLVDVRSDEEWNEAHFESAKHISIDAITENPETAFEGISKEQTVFLH